MLSGGSLWWLCDGLLLAFATPSTLAADAAVIVSQSPGAAQTNLLEPIARTIESTIVLPVERRTVCVMTRLLVNRLFKLSETLVPRRWVPSAPSAGRQIR